MQPAGTKEDPDAQYHNRGQFMYVLSPPRTVVAYRKVRCPFEHLSSSAWAWRAAAAATAGLCCACSPAHTAVQQHAICPHLCLWVYVIDPVASTAAASFCPLGRSTRRRRWHGRRPGGGQRRGPRWARPPRCRPSRRPATAAAAAAGRGCPTTAASGQPTIVNGKPSWNPNAAATLLPLPWRLSGAMLSGQRSAERSPCSSRSTLCQPPYFSRARAPPSDVH